MLKPDMDAALGEALREAHFISGAQVRRLEGELAEYVGVKHCITCANGTDALSLMLRAWGIGAGDAVFVPDFTFFASAETVRDRGATPIFVDVSRDTFNIDPQSLEECINKVAAKGRLRPKAVIPVDLFGMPADYGRIEEIARKHGLLLLEDGAQGFGGSQGGKMACSFGDAATTSFFPAKPLGCYGDGGAMFTNDDALAALVRSLAVHGKGGDKYDNVRIGVNSRLDTIQAAVLSVKLAALKSRELALVNSAADYYTERLASVAAVPTIPDGFTSSWAQYTLRLPDAATRDGLRAALSASGIPSMVYYPKRMSDQQAFADIIDEQVCSCPVAAELCGTVLALPIGPYITKTEQDEVVSAVLGYLRA